eukprot:7384041-Prymnesium_polylepis.1
MHPCCMGRKRARLDWRAEIEHAYERCRRHNHPKAAAVRAQGWFRTVRAPARRSDGAGRLPCTHTHGPPRPHGSQGRCHTRRGRPHTDTCAAGRGDADCFTLRVHVVYGMYGCMWLIIARP